MLIINTCVPPYLHWSPFYPSTMLGSYPMISSLLLGLILIYRFFSHIQASPMTNFIPSSARPMPGREFRKHEIRYKKSTAFRIFLRCRNNEVLKLRGASWNEQMVVEMPMTWPDLTESMHSWFNKRTNESINQWTSEHTNEWMNERMNGWMDEWVNERTNKWMNERTVKWMTDWLNEWF